MTPPTAHPGRAASKPQHRSGLPSGSGSVTPRPLSHRARRVLAALRQLAKRDIVCETTGAIARAIDASTDTVRRGIAELIAAGLLEPTGLRAGKAYAYRLLDGSPQPLVESPQPAAVAGAAGAPVGGPPAARLPAAQPPSSEMDPDDRRWLDEFEWTPELRREYTLRAATLTQRYWGFAGVDLHALVSLDTPGVCADCATAENGARPTSPLLRVGPAAYCVTHASLRLQAGARLAAMTVQAEARAA